MCQASSGRIGSKHSADLRQRLPKGLPERISARVFYDGPSTCVRDTINWARVLAFVTGLVNQELLLPKEYLAAESRILRARLPSRLHLSDPARGTGCGPDTASWEIDPACSPSVYRITRLWKGTLPQNIKKPAKSACARNRIFPRLLGPICARSLMHGFEFSYARAGITIGRINARWFGVPSLVVPKS
jgi:hypothetical protein